MPLDFPASPVLNQTYAIGNKVWQYNGKGWKLVPSPTQGIQGTQGTSIQGVQGPLSTFQGSQGVQGAQGRQGLQGVQGIGVQGLQGLQGTFGPATIPVSTDTLGSGDTIIATDNGKTVVVTGALTIANVFNTGENVVVYNDSAAQIQLTQGAGVTLRLAGTTQTGNRFLQQRGLATVICVKTGEYAISGAGVT